jgi:hypothetical protein
MTNPNPNLRDRQVYNRDRQVIRENQTVRENDGAATGLIIGILLTGLTALGIATYFLSQRTSTNPTPARTTIIERTKEVLPKSQPQSPPDVNITVPSPNPPDVNITVPPNPPDVNITAPSPAVPNPEVATPEAPSAAPSESAPASSNPQ